MTYKLRPYQIDAINATNKKFAEGGKRELMVLPTGGGKTVVFGSMCRGRMDRHQRSIIMVHRDELIRQAANKIELICDIQPGIEKAEERSSPNDAVVVASVQTLVRRQRLGDFQFGVVDESHHVTLDNTYGKILDAYQFPNLLGVTATPWRADKKKLAAVFEDTAYSASLMDLIKIGYLVDITVKSLPVSIDLSNVKMISGDFSERSLGDTLEPYLDKLADIVASEHAHRKMLSFVPLCDTSRLWTRKLQERGLPAEHIEGGSPDRADILRRFSSGETRFLSNAMLLCLDDKTEILTDHGWTSHDEISMDHKVANWNFDGSVFFESPTEIVRRPLADHEHMVSIDSRTINLRVTNTHRMIVGAGEGNKFWKKIPAQYLRAGHVLPVSGVAEPLAVSIEAQEVVYSKRKVSANAYNMRRLNNLGWGESFAEAERREDKRNNLDRKSPGDLSLDECKLIGFWIADGTVGTKNRGGLEYSMSQGLAYPAIIDWVDGLLSRLGVHFVRYSRDSYDCKHIRWSLCRGTGGGSQARNGIYHLEPYLKKDGTELFWALNEEQFDALVEGYWMGDGWHGKADDGFPKSLVFRDTKKAWIDLLCAIGSVRGWRCAVMPRPSSNPRHNDQWELRMIKGEDLCISSKTPIVHEAFAPEMVWCVRTTSKNIITRRNGKVAVMGNTEGYDEPSIDAIMVLRPTKSRGLYSQMLGRGTRPVWEGQEPNELNARLQAIASSSKPGLLVLDPMFVSERHNVLTVADIAAEDEDEAKSVKKRMREKGESLTQATEGHRNSARSSLAHALRANSYRKGYDKKLAELAYVFDCKVEDFDPIYAWHEQPVTQKQIDAIARNGITVDPDVVKNRGVASMIIDGIFKRRDKALATFKQVRLLLGKGHQNADKVRFSDVSAELARCEAGFYAGKAAPRAMEMA